jgi:large subunit ribosomal protein L4
VTDDDMVRRAARNLPWVNVMPSRGLNVYDILRSERLIADAAIFGEEADA